MSSTLNVHPPQTYSRLFRPWDNSKASETNMIAPTSIKSTSKSIWKEKASLVKLERCTPPNEVDVSATTSFNVKQNCSFYSNSNDSDRECGSSSSSSSSSSNSNSSTCAKNAYESTMNNITFFAQQNQPLNQDPSAYCMQNSSHAGYFFNSNPSLYNNVENDTLASLSSSSSLTKDNKLLYAAAANGMMLPTTNTFGVDPYTLGIMEHEYSRVMAEEAHLKALNARKQRPKKFKCPHCDVAFSNNGQLKGHIRIHTGERPFKCDVESCGKTFTRNEELTRHKRIHTGLRPYPCTICGKKFGRRDHLKKHMKTHMPQERQLGPAIYVPMYPYLYGY